MFWKLVSVLWTLKVLCKLTVSGREGMLTIATLREPDGRWTAEIVELPEILAYGDSRGEAIAKVEALALRLFADRLEHGDDVPEVHCLFAA